MNRGLNPKHEAERIMRRADHLLRFLPSGAGRLLWRNVLLLSHRPPDLILGHYLAIHGAQVHMLADEFPDWNDEEFGRIRNALVELLESEDSHESLLVENLRQISSANFHQAAGFKTLSGSLKTAVNLERPEFDTILIDGAADFLTDPEQTLAHLHGLCATGVCIEILGRPREWCGGPEFENIRRAAVDAGFGVRHGAVSQIADEGKSHSGIALGLFRLAEPMTEVPVEGRENDYIMAHCYARLEVAAQICKGSRVLDAGGGTAIGARKYLEAGAEHVTSLEVRAEAIKIAKSACRKEIEDDRLKLTHWDLNVTPLPFEDSQFDVVICLEVLEHIRRQAAAVAEFKRVLRPGGLLLISVPDAGFESAWTRIHQYENPFHVHVPTREELKKHLKGFRIVKWLRQSDLIGSVVIEEESKSSCSGSFVAPNEVRTSHRSAQVVMALCRKPKSTRKKKSDTDRTGGQSSSPQIANVTVPRLLQSTMRVNGTAQQSIAEAQLGHRKLMDELFEYRFAWWKKLNYVQEKRRHSENEAQDLRTQLETIEDESRQLQALRETLARNEEIINQNKKTIAEWRSQSDAWRIAEEKLRYENQRLETEKKTLRERIDEQNRQTEAFRNALEQLGEKLTKEIRKRDEELKNIREIEADIRESHADLLVQNKCLADNLAHRTEQVDHLRMRLNEVENERESLRSELANATAASDAANACVQNLESTIQKLIDHRNSLRSELDQAMDDLKCERKESAARDNEWRKRFDEQIGGAIIHVERRCLGVESRVYDLEEQIDRTGGPQSGASAANGESG